MYRLILANKIASGVSTEDVIVKELSLAGVQIPFNPKEFNLAKKKNNTLFKIENIEIKGNFLINKSKIKEKLSTIRKENIFFIKREDIEKPLKEIDFLHKIEVKKRYPNTIIVKIFETKPVAILFKNQVRYIIDSSSNLISFKKDMDLNNLPGIFGERAEKNFMNFFYLILFFHIIILYKILMFTYSDDFK